MSLFEDSINVSNDTNMSIGTDSSAITLTTSLVQNDFNLPMKNCPIESSQVIFPSAIEMGNALTLHNKPVKAYLSKEYLILQDFKTNNIIQSIQIKYIIGARVVEISKRFELHIFVYSLPLTNAGCCGASSLLLKKAHIKLGYQGSNYFYLQSWSNAIVRTAYGQPLSSPTENNNNPAPKSLLVTDPVPKRVIVYINPASGKGTAKKIWLKYIKDMFEQANLNFEVIFTQRKNFAYEHVLHELDINNIDMICTVSGDGLLYEVLNAISDHPNRCDILRKIAFGPLPGGTSNGLVKSILFESNLDFSVVNATFMVLKGQPQGLDLSYVETKITSQRSFLSMSWALIADIDIMSESMRYLGETRMYIAAVYYVMRKRTYHGKLSIYLGDDYDPLPPLKESLYQNPGDESKWKVIEANFTFIWVLNTSHAGASVYSGPGVRSDDGLLSIVVAYDAKRVDMLSLLLDMDTGKYIQNKNVTMYKTTKYRLEPYVTEGIYALDGEVVDYGPIQGVVEPSAAKIMSLR